MSRRPKLTHDHDTELARLYAEGWSLHQLAGRYGVHYTTIFQRLRRLGVKMRPRGARNSHPQAPPTPAQLVEMIRLRSVEGLSCRAIGERVGLTMQTVRLHLNRQGIARAPRLPPEQAA